MEFLLDPFQESNNTLESLADTISAMLVRPITIEDAHHRLLAYSSHNHETDPARIATIIGRRVPEKVINSLWNTGVMQRLESSLEPVRVNAITTVGLGDRVAIAVRKNNEILGYIWVIENQEPLNETQMQLLLQAAKAVSMKLLQVRMSRIKEEELKQEFFWQLLMGHLEMHEKIQAKAERTKLSLPTAFCVIIFQFPEEIRLKNYEQTVYLTNTLQQVRIYFSVYDRDQIIFLVGPRIKEELTWQSSRDFMKTIIQQLRERYDMSQVISGSGNIYKSYNLVASSYQEALTVLQIKRNFPNDTQEIYDYQHLGFYRFLPNLVKNIAVNRPFSHSFDRLREYDEKHQTRLLESVEVYLNCDSNTKEAANILHVHINTLLYRLKRIEEIGEIALNNPDQKFSLYLDLKISKLNES